MASPKKGDPVLFYGNSLEITGFEKKDDVRLAVVEDVQGLKVREAAREEMTDLRDQLQGDITNAQRAKLRKQVDAVEDKAREAMFRVKLRVDLLSYWPEREVWVSDGRILSDEQRGRYKEITGLTGNIPWSRLERQALGMIEQGD